MITIHLENREIEKNLFLLQKKTNLSINEIVLNILKDHLEELELLSRVEDVKKEKIKLLDRKDIFNV